MEKNSPVSMPDKIVAEMRTNPKVTRNELAGFLGLTPDGIKYHLQKLTKEGIIVHKGSLGVGIGRFER